MSNSGRGQLPFQMGDNMDKVISLRLAMSGIAIFALGGCATTIDLSVPSRKVDLFSKCVADPAVSWQLKDEHKLAAASSSGDIRSSLIAAVNDMTTRSTTSMALPLRTATRPTFTNIYAAKDGQLGASNSEVKQTSAADRSGAATAVARVNAVLGHPIQQKINLIYNNLSGTEMNTPIELDIGEVTDYMNRVSESTRLDDWTAHANSAVKSFIITAADNNATAEEKDGAVQDMAHAIFIEAYLKAYFRNGKFITGAVTVPSLESVFPELKKLNADDRKKLDDLLAKVKDKLSGFGKVSDIGFVSRTGASFQFPAVAVSFDVAKTQISATQLDYLAIGSQLVRVMLEAIFDAHDRLPAVSKATGVTLSSDRKGIEAIELPDYKSIKNTKDYEPVDEEAFGKIDAYANQLDGAAAVVTGRALRGVGPVALNNEAIAKLIETAIGAVVRKVGEKVGWCWYAIGPSVKGSASIASVEALGGGAITPIGNGPVPLDDVKSIRIVVKY